MADEINRDHDQKGSTVEASGDFADIRLFHSVTGEKSALLNNCKLNDWYFNDDTVFNT